jgi:hypothetical protein
MPLGRKRFFEEEMDNAGRRSSVAPTRPSQLSRITTWERCVALRARWSGRIGTRMLGRLTRERGGRRIRGDNVADGIDEHGRRRDGSRRRHDTPHTTADARAVVVVVARLRAMRHAVVMRGGRNGRRAGATMCRARVHHTRLPHDEREPDRENGRNGAEPTRLTHHQQNAATDETVPAHLRPAWPPKSRSSTSCMARYFAGI